MKPFIPGLAPGDPHRHWPTLHVKNGQQGTALKELRGWGVTASKGTRDLWSKRWAIRVSNLDVARQVLSQAGIDYEE